MEKQTRPAGVRPDSALIALLAIWLMLAPWALRIPSGSFARDEILAGLIILVCSLIRIAAAHTAVLSWISGLTAAWLIASPWVFHYLTNDVRIWNVMVVGVVIACLETLSLTATAMRRPWTPKETSSQNAGKR